MNIPDRQRLPHDPPLWVDPSKEVYFISVNCEPRGKNQLATPEAAREIFQTIEFRQRRFDWFVCLALLMPDHLHALLSFPPGAKPFKERIEDWKNWTAKHPGIAWQRDFFEHRIRREESATEKSQYILQNPVRAGLVKSPEEWPFIWFHDGERPEFTW
ncbi:MAG: hypothetical protein HY301_20525 [Verrucomicrobia bacterium]|nr:hypothetical protein [Verrucomicrobiota bacterium]